MNSHREIFRTNQPHEILLAMNELKERGVPHFGQEQSVTGLREAMPQTPIPAPGTAWAVLVPIKAMEDAKLVIEELGLVSQVEETLWSTGPAEASPVLKYIYIAILAIFLIGSVAEILKW